LAINNCMREHAAAISLVNSAFPSEQTWNYRNYLQIWKSLCVVCVGFAAVRRAPESLLSSKEIIKMLLPHANYRRTGHPKRDPHTTAKLIKLNFNQHLICKSSPIIELARGVKRCAARPQSPIFHTLLLHTNIWMKDQAINSNRLASRSRLVIGSGNHQFGGKRKCISSI